MRVSNILIHLVNLQEGTLVFRIFQETHFLAEFSQDKALCRYFWGKTILEKEKKENTLKCCNQNSMTTTHDYSNFY